jgi:hypothetical protein
MCRKWQLSELTAVNLLRFRGFLVIGSALAFYAMCHEGALIPCLFKASGEKASRAHLVLFVMLVLTERLYVG